MAKFQVKTTPASNGRPEAAFNQFGYDSGNGPQLLAPEAEALRIVKFEKTAWETAFAYITEKVMFNMRQVIRQCRKNYWGVYDNPVDPTTGRDKIWEHLTKTFVDYSVSAYDLDTKDITFQATGPDTIDFTSVVRSIVRNKLDHSTFGEDLKLALRQLAIDGTVVWTSDHKKGDLKIHLVDLLNFYIDPTVDSIAEADSVVERIVIPISEFQRLARANDWKNGHIGGMTNVSRYDSENNPGYNTQSNITFVELYKRRGLAKEFVITGDTRDQDLVPTEIICSGTNGNWYFHSASRRADNAKKGYEEAWLTRVHGRWYGEGIAERLIQKQIHFNILSNIRVNRSYLAQLGIFLVRKGSGITPQMLSRLAANGAISVTNLETDIKQLEMNEASEASYRDEENIYQWAQRYTGATDVINGQPIPASTPATNAAIQNNAAKTRFTLIREGIGMFLKRWLRNQGLPNIFATITKGELIRMHLQDEALDAFDEMHLVNKPLIDFMKQANANKQFINPEELALHKQKMLEQVKAKGTERFVKLLHDIDVTKYDIIIDVDNEEIDKPTLLTNLQQLLQTVAVIPGVDPKNIINIVRQSMDVMGLDSSLFKAPAIGQPPMGQPQEQQPQQPGQPPQGGGQNPQSAMNSTGITPGSNPPNQTPSQNPAENLAPALTQEPAFG